jgi:hypothetical protein
LNGNLQGKYLCHNIYLVIFIQKGLGNSLSVVP